MPSVEKVSDADDPRIARFRGVRDPELVRRRGQFIAEGRILVQRVIEHGGCRVRAVLVNPAALAQLAHVLDQLPVDVGVFVANTKLFLELTGYNIHRGCLALVDRPRPYRLEEAVATAATVVALEAVANADNVGAVFRSAAAFECGAVVLSPGCVDPFYRKAIRTSMGAVLRVPFAAAEVWPEALIDIRNTGFSIVALTPRATAVPLDAFVRERPARVVLVAGAEGEGLSAGVEAIADCRVRIPIAESVDSLNVGTAVAIALYALAAARE